MSLKAPRMIYADIECLLEKMHFCQKILNNLKQRKKLSIRLQVTHRLHVTHLIHQKRNLIITEKKTVWRGFVKTFHN